MTTRHTRQRTDFVGVREQSDIHIVAFTHTIAADAFDIVHRLLQDYDAAHTARVRIERLWVTMDNWCEAHQARAVRVHGMPDHTQQLLPVIEPFAHDVAVWPLFRDARRLPRDPLDRMPIAQFLRGPLSTYKQRWGQMYKRADDDEGHMRHIFFHE